MADQTKPEALADDDLDRANGGFGSWGEPVGTLKGQTKQGEGFIAFGNETFTLKRPGTNMEVVNEDE